MTIETAGFRQFIDDYTYLRTTSLALGELPGFDEGFGFMKKRMFDEALYKFYHLYQRDEGKSNPFVYFFVLYCAARTSLQKHELANICNEFLRLYDHFPVYSILWEAAHIYCQMGDTQNAKKYYELVIQNHEPTRHFYNLLAETKQQFDIIEPIFRQYNIYLSKYVNYFTDRTAYINNTASAFGVAETSITDAQEQAIEALLQQHWQNYLAGKIAKPKYQGLFVPKPLNKPLNILFFGPRKLRNNENTHEFYLADATIARGHNYYCLFFEQCNRDNMPFHEFLEQFKGHELHEMISKYKIDILYLDYATHPKKMHSPNFISILQHIKNKTGVKMMRNITDYYNSYYTISAEWFELMDIIYTDTADNNNTDENLPLYAHKFLHFPVIWKKPPNYLHENQAKDINFLCLGMDTMNAQKDQFVEKIMDYIEPPIKILLSFDNKVNTTQEYLKFYQRSKITSNTGCRFYANGEYYCISTARIYEAITSKCLLLEEGTESTKYIYIPYIHYIPVYCRDDVRIYTQFFIKNHAWREKITQHALEFFEQYYSTHNIWTHIEQRLGFME